MYIFHNFNCNAMYANLLNFEWQFINRNKSFYTILLFYISLELLMGIGCNLPFPNTFYNVSYVLNYIIGITSLVCISSTTLLAAQTLFREKDARFDSILFAALFFFKQKTAYEMDG